MIIGSMKRWFRTVTTTIVLCSSVALGAPSSVPELSLRLKDTSDFRVRVQAALQLGKVGDGDALGPLVAALDDPSESVRAAAAAALKQLGDTRAIEPLKEHRLDRSKAVREQIRDSLSSLDKVAAEGPSKVLVQLGSMKNQTAVKGSGIEAQLATESRKKLGELPGIEVLSDKVDSKKAAREKKLPLVLVSGQIQKLKASHEGGEVVYSASVEFVLHTMPDQSIAAKVSGSARGTLTAAESKDRVRAAELRHEVLVAAITSAVRRAPRAIRAAARL
jgi:hypothetical protein